MKLKNATDILNDLVPPDKNLRDFMLAERFNAECAELIYNPRIAAGLRQAQLAKRVGTSQSAIARLEDADYRGRTILMMIRIAEALELEYHHEFQQRAKTILFPTHSETGAKRAAGDK